MKTLTRDQILSADDLKSKRVKVPEWGGEVIVQELTAAGRDEYEASVVKTNGSGEVTIDSSNMRAKLLALSLVNDKGELLFTEKDVEALGRKSAAATSRVTDVAQKISKVGEDELEKLGKVSRPTRSGDSASS